MERAAIKLLEQMENFRIKNIENDFAIRVCQAMVAESAGYKNRNDWTCLLYDCKELRDEKEYLCSKLKNATQSKTNDMLKRISEIDKKINSLED